VWRLARGFEFAAVLYPFLASPSTVTAKGVAPDKQTSALTRNAASLLRFGVQHQRGISLAQELNSIQRSRVAASRKAVHPIKGRSWKWCSFFVIPGTSRVPHRSTAITNASSEPVGGSRINPLPPSACRVCFV
jgi:hypothetical protein